MMGKKTFSNCLQHTIEKQDESLKDRFAVADSVLMNSSTEVLKSKTTPDTPKRSSKTATDSCGDLVIRDTFSLPTSDYALINKIKTKALKQQMLVTKSEIIRAGLLLMDSMLNNDLKAALLKVDRIKTGRKPQ